MELFFLVIFPYTRASGTISGHPRALLDDIPAQRRKLLDYLKGKNDARYVALIARLGLRR
jgi:hypothetical protein